MELVPGGAVQERIGLEGFSLMGMLEAASSVPEGLEAAAAALRVLNSGRKGAAAARCAVVVRSFDDDLHEVVRRSAPDIAHVGEDDRLPSGSRGWRRWISAVRSASAAVSEAYRVLFGEPETVSSAELRLRAAARLSESIKWGLIDRQAPDGAQWADWATYRVSGGASEVGSEAMLRDDIEKEYLAALAFQSAALDQLSLPGALTAVRLVRACLPFMSISSRSVSGALYHVEGREAPVPVRMVERLGNHEGECFCVSSMGLEFLDVCAARLSEGDVPSPLAGSDRRLAFDVVAHLRSLWSGDSRRRRDRRHHMDGIIEVASGWGDSLALLSRATAEPSEQWHVLDVSRSGIRAAARIKRDGGVPEIGCLLCFRFVDGTARQVGIVRRVQATDASRTEIGIETLSASPVHLLADDGQQSIDVLLCGTLSRGEAVRVAGATRSLRIDVPLYVVQRGTVWKLRPMEFSMRGEGFELRVYQVL